MLKKLCKKISMLLLCSGLLVFNAVPASASANTRANTSSNVKTATSAVNNVTPVTLVDGSSATQTVTSGSTALFLTNVNDSDLRNIVVSSTSPVKTRITPSNSGFPIQYNSGDYRPFNMIARHFIPGVQYNILVQTESTASVTVSMSKATSGASWIYQGSSTNVEQNYLYGGQTETYGIGFEQAGTYNITIASTGKLTATYSTSPYPVQLSGNSYIISNVKITNPSYDQSAFALYLTSNDAAGTAGSYTISVQKVN